MMHKSGSWHDRRRMRKRGESVLFLSSPWKLETDGKVRELWVIECFGGVVPLKKSGTVFKAEKTQNNVIHLIASWGESL